MLSCSDNALSPAPRKPVKAGPSHWQGKPGSPVTMAPGEGWEVAARVNYLSPLSSLTFGLIFPDTENKVNHVLWVFYFMCSGRKVQSGQETNPRSHSRTILSLSHIYI